LDLGTKISAASILISHARVFWWSPLALARERKRREMLVAARVRRLSSRPREE
jgi:hypothetical protein